LKIQQNLGVSRERVLPVRDKGTGSPSFQQIFQEKQFDFSQDRLQALFTDLEQQGNRLSHSRSMQDLLSYKQTIRTFLQEVVQNGVKLEEHRGFHPNGREKRLVMIKQVNSQLLELSDQVLTKQAPSVDLLQKMGEIKGLLVNLYL
jgi:uncharacterized protein YaaR (DUF327 family)